MVLDIAILLFGIGVAIWFEFFRPRTASMKLILGLIALTCLWYGGFVILLEVGMKFPFWVVVGLGMVLGGVAAGLAYQQHEAGQKKNDKENMDIKPEAEVTKSAEKAQDEKRMKAAKLTLIDLFKTEFPDFMKLTCEYTITPKDGIRIEEKVPPVEATVYMEWLGKSEFIGFYVPSSNYSFIVCGLLADKWQKIITDANSKVEIQFGVSSSMDKTSLKELTFTRRVYLYHEDSFDLQQLAEIERVYKSQGLSVVFRGPQYLISARLAEINKAKQDANEKGN
jgi:hypothetical protein